MSLRDRNPTNLHKSFNNLHNNICMICLDLKDLATPSWRFSPQATKYQRLGILRNLRLKISPIRWQTIPVARNDSGGYFHVIEREFRFRWQKYIFISTKRKEIEKKSTDNLSFGDKIKEFKITIEENRDRF